MWKGKCELVRGKTQPIVVDNQIRDVDPEAAVPHILPRTIYRKWPNNDSQVDTEDLMSGIPKENRGSGRTSISVLREGPGNNGPQWRKLYTDQTVGDLLRVKTTLGLGTNSVQNLEKGREEARRTLNPSAKCFYPYSVEFTMMTDIVPGEKESEEDTVEPKADKESPMVWNLKGRSIDEILVDLEALKNDPDIPMPVIEADIAPAEDFEQYTRSLKEKDCETEEH
jgi:hypothetical protein